MIIYCPKCQSRNVKTDVVEVPRPLPYEVSMDALANMPNTVDAVLRTSLWRASCQECGYSLEYQSA